MDRSALRMSIVGTANDSDPGGNAGKIAPLNSRIAVVDDEFRPGHKPHFELVRDAVGLRNRSSSRVRRSQ